MSSSTGADSDIFEKISSVLTFIRHNKISNALLKEAENELLKPSTRLSDLKRCITKGLVNSGAETRLENAVYKCLQRQSRVPHPIQSVESYKEPIAYIRKAQMNWEKRVLKSLNSMSTELGVPLARQRTDKEQRDIQAKWTELGTDEWDVSQYRPVYAPKDFLEVITGIKNPNVWESSETASVFQNWGTVQAPLHVKDIHQLRLQFSEMSINQTQTGIEDCIDLPDEVFEVERLKLGRKVLEHGSTPVTEEYCKKGCPISLRAELWRQMLVVTIDAEDRLYYQQLKANVLRHHLLIDSLIYKDMQLTVSNDDVYFVFEDYMCQVLLPFLRDTTVLEHFKTSSATPPKAYVHGKLGKEEYAVFYPPNGVIPFHGFSMYVVPLCYIYDDPVILYFMFRDMYCSYLHKLHAISSDPQGILSLCLLFERLLQTTEPQLFYHLKSLDIQPLKLAFKWLIRAFSGFLNSQQVLLLWDRILAYRSLELLPILSVAIFSFRKSNLMQIQNMTMAEAVLADISSIRVVPLIQLTLFSHTQAPNVA